MKIKLCVLAVAGMVSLYIVSLGFSQSEPAVAPKEIPAANAPAPENISWVWGEIKSVDSASMAFNIIYMDYQTDEEKELSLNTDQETKFEGVGDFGGLKPGDTASIDYIMKDGKNIARNISIEKIEEMPEAPVKTEDVIKPPAP